MTTSKSFEGKNHSWTFNFSDADFGDFVLSWGEDQEIADFGRPPNKFLPESNELARYKVVDDLAPELIDIFPILLDITEHGVTLTSSLSRHLVLYVISVYL